MTPRPHLPLADAIGAAYDDLPRYDRSAPAGVVHLGVGAFHRAHQAVYFHKLMNDGEAGWLIQGASLRSPRVATQMNPQDGLYTTILRDNGVDRHELIGSLKGVIAAPEDPDAVIEAMAHPSVRLVTLTITEKGYKPTRETGGLLDPDPDVQHDAANPDRPRTALGFLAAALARRRDRGLSGLTMLSCDNLSDNGVRVAQGVLAYAAGRDPNLPNWIRKTCAFPSSMVDRIVPATTRDDVARLEKTVGVHDPAMVKTEPFSQWVVQDWFAGPRPPLDRVGVQFTKEVFPWEKAKLRLLNGAHSGLAYLGALAGCDHVHEAMAAPGVAAFVNRLWDEAQATLDPIDGFDPARYRDDLTARFCNSSLQHRTVQIAMDGSQKLPQRLLDTIRARLAADAPFPALALAVAGWMRWQLGRDEAGEAYAVDDPLAAQTAALVAGRETAADIAAGLFTLEPVFGADLPGDDRFTGAVVAAFQTVLNDGALAAVRRLAAQRELSA